MNILEIYFTDATAPLTLVRNIGIEKLFSIFEFLQRVFFRSFMCINVSIWNL